MLTAVKINALSKQKEKINLLEYMYGERGVKEGKMYKHKEITLVKRHSNIMNRKKICFTLKVMFIIDN